MGINRVPDTSARRGYRLVGDVEFEGGIPEGRRHHSRPRRRRPHDYRHAAQEHPHCGPHQHSWTLTCSLSLRERVRVRGMRTSDFDYPATPGADSPDASRTTRLIPLAGVGSRHQQYRASPLHRHVLEYLRPGDLMVFNQSRVIPARLFGKRDDNGGQRGTAVAAPGGRGSVGSAGPPGPSPAPRRYGDHQAMPYRGTFSPPPQPSP